MMGETIGLAIALEWHEGPLLEISLVTLSPGMPYDKLVQVDTLLCTIEGERATVRFSRENLQAALDLIDGKPVTDYHGEVIAAPAHEAGGVRCMRSCTLHGSCGLDLQVQPKNEREQ